MSAPPDRSRRTSRLLSTGHATRVAVGGRQRVSNFMRSAARTCGGLRIAANKRTVIEDKRVRDYVLLWYAEPLRHRNDHLAEPARDEKDALSSLLEGSDERLHARRVGERVRSNTRVDSAAARLDQLKSLLERNVEWHTPPHRFDRPGRDSLARAAVGRKDIDALLRNSGRINVKAHGGARAEDLLHRRLGRGPLNARRHVFGWLFELAAPWFPRVVFFATLFLR